LGNLVASHPNSENKADSDYILECIERIEAYTQEGREAFMGSTLVQDGVIRNLEVIGEATKRLSPDLRNQHPTIP